MSWRTLMHEGSYRGERFFLEGSERESGRRTALHSLPDRDDPVPQDLGRAPRRFQLTALVYGPQYFSARDRLIEAFERSGPGELVHPFYGPLRVVVDGPVRIQESTDAGGVARFNVTVVTVEEEELRLELIPRQAAPSVGAASARLRVTAQAVAAERFSIADRPGWVVAQALGRLQAVTAQMRAVRSRVQSRMLDVTRVLLAIADFASAARALVDTPAEMARELDALTSRVVGSPGDVRLVLERATPRPRADARGTRRLSGPAVVSSQGVPLSYDEVDRATAQTDTERTTATTSRSAGAELFLQPFGAGSESNVPVLSSESPILSWGAVPPTPLEPVHLDRRPTATGQVAVNERAILRLVQMGVIASLAEAIEQTAFVVVDDATRAHSEVETLIDMALGETSTDTDAALDERAALVELKTALARHIAGLSTPVRVRNGPVARPALVLAYEALGDASRAASLARQARWAHPGFVPPNDTVEVWP